MKDTERKEKINKLYNNLIEINKKLDTESINKNELIRKKEEVIKIKNEMNNILNSIKNKQNESLIKVDTKQKNVTNINLEKYQKKEEKKSESGSSGFIEEIVFPIIGGTVFLGFSFGWYMLTGTVPKTGKR